MCESLIKKEFQIPQAYHGRLNLRTMLNELLQGPKILNKNYQEAVIYLDNQILKPPEIRLPKIPHWYPSGQWPTGNKLWLIICCSYLLNIFSILVLGSEWTRNDITDKNYTIISTYKVSHISSKQWTPEDGQRYLVETSVFIIYKNTWWEQ